MVLALVLALATVPDARALSVDRLPTTPLGREATWMVEEGREQSLQHIQQLEAQGAFHPGTRSIPTFGVGASPLWMHLDLQNTSARELPAHFVLGATWTDHVDVYLVRDGQLVHQWHAGDAMPGALGVSPGLGIVLPMQLQPGHTTLYARFQTSDALMLPVFLLDNEALEDAQQWAGYAYGALFGFLLAMLAYNALICLALRETSYLYYALYLLSFMGFTLAYAGHGWAWWWPLQPDVQQLVLPVMLVAHGACGLLFASHLLNLHATMPRLHRVLGAGYALALVATVVSVLTGHQSMAATLSGAAIVLATFLRVALGAFAYQRRVTSSRYFLAGALCGAVGTLVTALVVFGFLRMTPWRYHFMEIGLVMEASLLGLALVSRMRLGRKARREAEHMAMRDALTGLLNRRGFADIATPAWADTGLPRQPLSLVMLDIDHFKRINDHHGHDTGDRVLVAMAEVLAQQCRSGDQVARWGGEEFIVLLPGASLAQAVGLAERLRQAVGQMEIAAGSERLPVSISLGVAERQQHARLDDLINEADRLLYSAKRGGRNRVAHSDPATLA